MAMKKKHTDTRHPDRKVLHVDTRNGWGLLIGQLVGAVE